MSKQVNENDIRFYMDSIKEPGFEAKNDAEKKKFYSDMKLAIDSANDDRTYGNIIKVINLLEKNGIPIERQEVFLNYFVPEKQRTNEEDLEAANAKIQELESQIDHLLNAELPAVVVEPEPKKTHKTLETTKNIAKTLKDFYQTKASGKIVHDSILGLISISAGAVAISGYLTGKLAVKTAKVVGKTAGKTYRGTKGMIEKANAKKELNNRNRAVRAVKEGRKVSKDIVKVLRAEAKENAVDDNFIVDENKKEELHNIRKGKLENAKKFTREISRETDAGIEELRKKLNVMRTASVSREFAREFDSFTENEITEIMNGVRITEEGELEYTSGPELTADEMDDIDFSGLGDKLRKFALMPRIEDLTDDQILTISKSIRVRKERTRENPEIETGEIYFELPEGEEVDIDVDRFMRNMSGPELYERGETTMAIRLNKVSEQVAVNESIVREVQSLRKLNSAKKLDKQMEFIYNQTRELVEKGDRGEQTSADIKSRDALRKIAEQKVKSLEEVGIVKTIEKGKKQTHEVLSRAATVLNLENTRAIDDKKIEKMKGTKETKAKDSDDLEKF